LSLYFIERAENYGTTMPIAPNGNGNKFNLSKEHLEKLTRKAEARGMTLEEYVDYLIQKDLELPPEENRNQ
jgi:hypothetical protein